MKVENLKLRSKIQILVNLGENFFEVLENENSNNFPGFNSIYVSNPWFIPDFVKYSLKTWSKLLSEDKISAWLQNYNLPNFSTPKTLGLVFAGNIPMVGMHDFISGFICGYNLKIKLSSKDNILMRWVIERLKTIGNISDEKIIICDSLMGNFDKIIATGSNNSNRYFEYYFAKTPNILRKNRTSIAILDGNETQKDLENLADDIFLYFGLGCRNVTKLYVPKNYNFEALSKAIEKYSFLRNHNKYANNLDYRFAIFTMNKVPITNLGHLFLRENKDLQSYVSVLNFEFYDKKEELIENINKKSEELQCVITKIDNIANRLDFGASQNPELYEYADNVDTINFLIK
ncbi:MAG: Acyl-CoA reductase (LuxC) [Bacteroidetes bacterium ADurb.Bin028]|nr:MAG: Acyl-CoA reductase (LuxC) [Bacteroidetes bacterium ADurb.Bin028]